MKPFICRCVLPKISFARKSDSFLYERFCAFKVHFETEVQGDLEMACPSSTTTIVINCEDTGPSNIHSRHSENNYSKIKDGI